MKLKLNQLLRIDARASIKISALHQFHQGIDA